MTKKYTAVFFDFDGVILDSVNVKTLAFGEMFRKYGEDIAQRAMDYHLKHGGVSRFEKFKYYYENLLNLPINDKIIDALSEEFTQIAFQGVMNSPFIEGALETLEFLQDQNVPCYVISGTPHDEINKIVEQKGLSKFFKGIYGSPRQKWEIAGEIIEEKGYSPKDCLFIGDAMSDYECAKKLGLEFLGIVLEGNKSIFPEETDISPVVKLK